MYQEEQPVGNLTIRLRWYSWPSLIGLGGMALFVGLGFVSPGMFGVAGILAVEWVISKYATKIEVTPTHVRLSIWLFRRESVRRDEIYAMHWYGRSFTFVNDAQRVLLSLRGPGWTRGPLLDLSESLGVRLYNHRTRRGLGQDAWDGQLVQRAW